MPKFFHYLITATDELGNHSKFEMKIVARDEGEAREEISQYFKHHQEIESWCIGRTVEVYELEEASPFVSDYHEKGPHSHISTAC